MMFCIYIISTVIISNKIANFRNAEYREYLHLYNVTAAINTKYYFNFIKRKLIRLMIRQMILYHHVLVLAYLGNHRYVLS